MSSEIVRVTVAGIPESVNHLWRGTRSGRHYKTAKAKDFEFLLTHALRTGRRNKNVYDGAVRLVMVIGRKTKRRYDLDNRIKSVQDCLAPAGIIADDSQVVEISARKILTDEDTTMVIVETLEAGDGGADEE